MDAGGDRSDALIRQQLERLLVSPMFARAPRQSRFLRFVVEQTLAKSGENLKEHRIGIEVYERREDYDTRADPIVRVEAARLRAKLREYYEGPGSLDQIRFELPKGTYAPVITGLDEEPEGRAGAGVQEHSNAEPTTGLLPRWAWVSMFTILAAGGAGIWFGVHWRGPAADPAAEQSIAVLPFQDHSERSDQGAFCEGLTGEVTDELARASGLRVSGLTSAGRFSSRKEDLKTIGSKLGVTHLVEGTVQSSGARVRVTTRLVDVKTGFQLWSGTMDRNREDLFALQDEIAGAIARALRVELARRKEGDAAGRTPERLKAHNLFLEGRRLHRRMDPASLLEARALHEQAVSADPTYALAHSGLSHIYISILSVGLAAPSELRDLAFAEAQKAVELDPGLSDAYSAQIRLARDVDFDWQTARTICQSAQQFAQNSASVLVNCGTFYSLLGEHARAEENFRAALKIDPLWAGVGDGLAHALYRAGRLSEAESSIRSVRATSPEYLPAAGTLARILAAGGKHAEALDMLDRRSSQGRLLVSGDLALMAYLCAKSNNKKRSQTLQRQLKDLAGRERVSNTSFALVALGLGDQSGALAGLEAALESREPQLAETLVDPLFQPLAATDRFRSLKRRLNLP